jgi:hypothetical protein
MSPSTSPSTSSKRAPPDRDALDDTYLRAVAEALAPRIGPIARLLVRQAAQDIGDRERFLQRLQQRLPEEDIRVLAAAAVPSSLSDDDASA